MTPLPRKPRRRSPRPTGFSITELMVIVAVIAILGGITISNTLNSWRDTRLQEITTQFSGWLEEVSRAPETLNTSCVVTMSSQTSLNAGDVLATVAPAGCAPQASFRLPDLFGGKRINFAMTTTSPVRTITFTPRQAVTNTTDVQLRLAFPSQAPVRCIRISGGLGLIRTGFDNASSSTGADCPATSFDTI